MEIVADQGANRSTTAGDAQLASGIGEMSFHGRLGDTHFACDFIGLKVTRDTVKAEQFLWCQARGSGQYDHSDDAFTGFSVGHAKASQNRVPETLIDYSRKMNKIVDPFKVVTSYSFKSTVMGA